MPLYKLLTFSLIVCGTVGQNVVYCPVTYPNGTQVCVFGFPSTSVALEGRAQCARACLESNCEAFNFDEVNLKCTLYPTLSTFQPDYGLVYGSSSCNIYQEFSKQIAGDATMIPAPNCSFPFTFLGKIYYSCMNTVYDPVRECNKFACFKPNRTWATCLPHTKGFMALQTSIVNVKYNNKTILVSLAVRSIHGWIIFQVRNSSSLNFNYNRTWTEFSNGFGETTGANFYLGNEPLSQLTGANPHSLRVELLAAGAWYSAEYFTVKVDALSLGYALHVAGYSGDAGDSLTSADGVSFTTYDAPLRKCNVTMSGWWYDPCTTKSTSNLNNPFGYAGQRWIWWATLAASQSSGANGVSIQYTRMMIRATGG